MCVYIYISNSTVRHHQHQATMKEHPINNIKLTRSNQQHQTTVKQDQLCIVIISFVAGRILALMFFFLYSTITTYELLLLLCLLDMRVSSFLSLSF